MTPLAERWRFMQKYPPVLWKELDDCKELRVQCARAAESYKQQAEEAGKFQGKVVEQYKLFMRGMQ